MRTLAIAILAFTIAVLAGSAHGATPMRLSASQPSWSSDGTRIAFSGAVKGGRSDIYVIRFDGTGLRNITAEGDQPEYLYPAWAPGSNLVASGTELGGPTTNHEVYSISSAVEGTTQQVATSSAIGPISWSHDRRFIAIDDHESVIVARTDGSEEHVVVAGGGSGLWSPRVDRLVAAREYYTGSRSSIDVVLVDAAGHVLRRLTHPPKHLPKGAPLDTSNEPVAWSKDGSKLLVYSTRAARAGLYLMRANGSHATRVATARYADLAPRGTAVVYSGKGIWVVATNGKGRRRVSPNGRQPRWSPDGQWIAYTVRRPSGASGIDLVRPDGTQRHPLVGS